MQSMLAARSKAAQRGTSEGTTANGTSQDSLDHSVHQQGPGDPLSREDEKPSSPPAEDPRSSTFGVQSLEEVIQTAEDMAPRELNGSGNGCPSSSKDTSDETRVFTPQCKPFYPSTDSSPRKSPNRYISRPSSVNTLSLPLTPVDLHSPVSDSAPPSTPKSVGSMRSFRLSDDDGSIDEASSQAVASNVDESEDGGQQHEEKIDNEGRASSQQQAPQLVMPSIRMPRRRPFTEKGKHIGKLKIMLVGAQGSGKTSLIKSLVHLCDDIVYIDSFPSHNGESALSQSQKSKRGLASSRSTRTVTEIHASTRSCPSWWTNLDERGRRKSLSEPILDRNICFVDTPGFVSSSFDTQSSNILKYIEGSLHRNASVAHLSDDELLSIFSGNGGVQVDLVLFFVSGRPAYPVVSIFYAANIVKSALHQDPQLRELEWHLLQRLSTITNVVAVVGKSDLLPVDSLDTSGPALRHELRARNIKTFVPKPAHQTDSEAPYPFFISSAISDDDDNMDASLLMSPDYTAPLVPSDLPLLISSVFDPSTASHLRHLAARKFIQWRHTVATNSPLPPPPAWRNSLSSQLTPHLYHQATGTSLPLHSLALPQSSTLPQLPSPPPPPSSSAFSTTLATRLAEHTQREQRLAQVHLARWANDLQRALRNERARFAALQQAEKMAWLREQLGQCALDSDALLPLADGQRGEKGEGVDLGDQGRPGRHAAGGRVDPRDPLGLLEWRGRLFERGVVVVQVLGGVGMVGAVAVWCARVWGWGSEYGVDGSDWGRGEGGLSGGVGDLLAGLVGW